MQLQLNDSVVTIPASLSEFTLGQRITFQQEYGNDLDEWVQRIISMEDGIEKELETTEFRFEQMYRTFAFFAGCTPEALKECEFVDDVANIYYSCLANLLENESKVELLSEYIWKGETWVIHPPELKHGSKMTFGEFIDSKQMVKDLAELGKGHWEKMLKLSAIYLRKKDEEYHESFLYEDSERLKLMEELPMDIAMAVGFFLTASMNLFINHFRSSSLVEPKEVVNTLLNTSSDGDG